MSTLIASTTMPMRTTSMRATPMRTTRMNTASVNAPAPRLRLTKRGRTVLTTVVAAPLVLGAFLFALNGGGATASLTGSDVPFTYVTIASGQSLWQVAERIAPQADPRDVIAEIQKLNQLDGADVYAGQELAIPAQYAK